MARPNNFNDLKSSDEFHNLMGLKITIREYIIIYTEILHDTIDALIFMIDQELGKKFDMANLLITSAPLVMMPYENNKTPKV